MKNYEVELRALITKEQYISLKKHFDSHATGVQDNAETYTFLTSTHNIKIKKLLTQKKAKITVKKGAEFEQLAEEIELPINPTDVARAIDLITTLGFTQYLPSVQERINYIMKNITVSLKHETHWGYHIEAEIVVNDEAEIQYAKNSITQFFNKLGLTPMTEKETRSLINSIRKKHNMEAI